MDQLLRTTLIDAVGLLTSEDLSYALVGGIAASIRGEPRATADVDFVIGTDVDGALGLMDALDETPFQTLLSDADEVVRRAFILPLRHRTTGVKVDMAIGLSGFEQQLIERAVPVDLAGETVRLTTAEDLLLMKLLAGRPRDLQDATGIVRVQGDSLDWDYCKKLADDLGRAVDMDLVTPLGRLRDEQLD